MLRVRVRVRVSVRVWVRVRVRVVRVLLQPSVLFVWVLFSALHGGQGPISALCFVRYKPNPFHETPEHKKHDCNYQYRSLKKGADPSGTLAYTTFRWTALREHSR